MSWRPNSSSWRPKHVIDVKKCVTTSKARHDVRQIRHDVQNTSWRPKHVMTSKKNRHDVKKCVMTSKTHHDVQNTSWRHKMRHDVKNTFDVKKGVISSKTRHELNKFVMMSPPTPTLLNPLHPPPHSFPLPYLHYIFSTMYYLLPHPPPPPPPPLPTRTIYYQLCTTYKMNTSWYNQWYNIIMFRVMFHVLYSMADTQKTDKQTDFFLTSYQYFWCTFWHHDVFSISVLIDVMTYFRYLWGHDVSFFNILYVYLTLWRTFCHDDVLFFYLITYIFHADMTVLRRRWPRAVFRTMDRYGRDMEHLRRGARHRPDRAFRHNAPGFCPVCEVWIESALDMHMLNIHRSLFKARSCWGGG